LLTIAVVASSSACVPRAARSSIIIRTPPALPIPATGGGWITRINAS
jgi:hypothetical protein